MALILGRSRKSRQGRQGKARDLCYRGLDLFYPGLCLFLCFCVHTWLRRLAFPDGLHGMSGTVPTTPAYVLCRKVVLLQ